MTAARDGRGGQLLDVYASAAQELLQANVLTGPADVAKLLAVIWPGGVLSDIDKVDAARLAAFRELVRQRLQGRPVAQLVGHTTFLGRRFEVDDSVLIPRDQTTEPLVRAATALARDLCEIPPRPLTVVDVGTGSGNVALSVLLESPGLDLRMTGVDISARALQVAARNRAMHQQENRLRLMESDLLERIPAGIDLVVSNPPYMGSVPSRVRYEPVVALKGGGQDGSGLTGRLLEQAASKISPDGAVLIELAPTAGGRVMEKAGELYRYTELLTDQDGVPRCLVASQVAVELTRVRGACSGETPEVLT